MKLLKPKEAAQLAGVSILTIKYWMYDGKIKLVQTIGGHHRVGRWRIKHITRMQWFWQVKSLTVLPAQKNIAGAKQQ